MKIRADIAELLRAGVPQKQIARRLHCAPITVQRAREALDIPSPGAGWRATVSCEDALRAHTEPSDDGHVRWAGPVGGDGTPLVYAEGGQKSAYRVAFLLHYGRQPVGRVTSGCGRRACVRGEHLADRPMREANARADRAFEEIFRGAA